MPPLSKLLLPALFVAWMAAAGVVLGACLLGRFGPTLFGDLPGPHGYGNMGYFFYGVFAGFAVGLGAGLLGLLKTTPQQRAWVAGGTGLCAALAAAVIEL